MAIEKTTFVATTLTERQTEVYNWLTANATDYFETITNDTENSKIICSFSECENAKLEFGFIRQLPMCRITNEVGTHYDCGKYGYDPALGYTLKIAIKTSYGMYFKNDKDPYSILLTKNNDNTTSIVNNSPDVSIICPEKSKVLTVTSKVITTDMTSFAPIPIAEGVYPENMFFTPFSSVRNTGVITDDSGQKYWYDGYCAIKE